MNEIIDQIETTVFRIEKRVNKLLQDYGSLGAGESFTNDISYISEVLISFLEERLDKLKHEIKANKK